jgi:hypothetical protein
MYSHQQSWRTKGQNRFCLEMAGAGGRVAQIMYTHVSKCKNDEIRIWQKKRGKLYSCSQFQSMWA